MASAKFILYLVVRHLTLVSITTLIIISVYYLNATLELFKKMLDHIDETNEAVARHTARNGTVSVLFVSLQRQAQDMYRKHEPMAIVNIVTFATLIASSTAGLVVTIKKLPIFMIIYGLTLDIIYSTTFLYVSRIKSWVCGALVLVSILTYIHAGQIRRQQMMSKVSISSSSSELMKEQRVEYKYEDTSEIV